MARRARWSIPVRDVVDEIKSDWRSVAIGSALEAYSRLIIRSPVDTGRFRGNWMIAVGTEPTGMDLNRFDKSGSETIAKGFDVSGKFQLGDTIMIRNNLAYAVPLEYGWSKQAPAGMVRITSGEFPEIVRSIDAGMAKRGA